MKNKQKIVLSTFVTVLFLLATSIYGQVHKYYTPGTVCGVTESCHLAKSRLRESHPTSAQTHFFFVVFFVDFFVARLVWSPSSPTAVQTMQLLADGGLVDSKQYGPRDTTMRAPDL